MALLVIVFVLVLLAFMGVCLSSYRELGAQERYSHRTPRTLGSTQGRDLFVPQNPTEAPREGFPRGTAVYDGR